MRFPTKADQKIKQIPIHWIVPNKSQPRAEFSLPELQELADSIRANGVLQPLTVRKHSAQEYELVAGERRLRASKLAGLTTVPCILVSCDDEQAAVFALLENLQRVDLGPFEEAEGICRLIATWGVTQEEAARRLGKKQSTVANKLRLLKLTEPERELIVKAGLTERHARALLRIQDDSLRMSALQQVIEKHLNVKQTEEFISRLLEHLETRDKKNTKRTVVIKDVRIFMNTIQKAVSTMRLSGISAVTAQNETDDYIECVVRIPKAEAVVQKASRSAG